jgi:hypothetical protein
MGCPGPFLTMVLNIAGSTNEYDPTQDPENPTELNSVLDTSIRVLFSKSKKAKATSPFLFKVTNWGVKEESKWRSS